MGCDTDGRKLHTQTCTIHIPIREARRAIQRFVHVTLRIHTMEAARAAWSTEPVGVVGQGRVVGLAADELGNEGRRRRRRRLLLGAGVPATVLLGGGAGAGGGVDEEEGVLGTEEAGRVVFRHSRPVGAITE